MIVVDGQKLKFLLAGRPLIVEVHREYRRGRDYAVGKTFRKATCRAVVEHIEQTGGKTWRLTLRHAYEDKPVYLARSMGRGDYTTEIARAAKASDGPIEAADQGWLDRTAKQLSERDDAERRSKAKENRLRGRRAA